ncbi:MAG: mercury transporter MerT [Alphaproteobacteria bacterium 62-8]|nr:MAG: mercury transporter MerT [Alphaproteobacteria bacterium 62-8]
MSDTPTTIGAGAAHATAVAPARQDGDRTPRLLAVGGILGALGAASCCVIPFALFLAGVSGAWIGNLTALEPYQPIFAGVSLALIGFGAWRLRRKREVACADGYCATPQSDRIAKIGLWTAATLVVLAVGFPYVARYFL